MPDDPNTGSMYGTPPPWTKTDEDTLLRIQRDINEREARRRNLLRDLNMEQGMTNPKSRDAVYTDEQGRPFVEVAKEYNEGIAHPDGEIPAMMERLDKQIMMVKEQALNLRDRVGSVLGPDMSEVNEQAPGPRDPSNDMSPLGHRIEEATDEIARIGSIIQDATVRLRL